MALSLLGDMAAVEASVVLMGWVVEMKMRLRGLRRMK